MIKVAKIMQSKLTQKHEIDFSKVYKMITDTRSVAFQHVNKALVTLYWSIGQFISNKAEYEGWGLSTVDELSHYIISRDQATRGFSSRNIWRMKKFYETYKNEELSTLLTEIPWSSHLHILSKTKTREEKIFYLELAAKYKYSARDFARLIDSSTFERTMLADKKLPTVLTVLDAGKKLFKDSYIFEFLEIPDNHREHDLRKALIYHLRKFLLELGSDFSLIGEEYPIQVGMKDFRIDLLMHNRELNCLVAIELKVTEFQPEHLGKLQFYLEALDQQVKKPHENPSIGILICKTKDDEVVKYALNRNISPTMISEYETKLIDKDVLQKKLHELSESLSNIED